MSTCPKHPKYEAKARPRAQCVHCWLDWFEKHEDVKPQDRAALSIAMSKHTMRLRGEIDGIERRTTRLLRERPAGMSDKAKKILKNAYAQMLD